MTDQSTQISLQPYNIQRPEKVRWLFPFPTDGDVLSCLKSKTTRSFLRKSEEQLQEHHITWEHEVLTKETYLDWLNYYVSKMTDQGFDIFATPEWFDERIAEQKKVEAIFFYQNETMVGSIVFTTLHEERADACFKASEHLEEISRKRESLGAIIDYFFLKMVVARNIRQISMGRSRNAFGVTNKLGYLDYKLRFGCEPIVEPGFPLLDTVPVNEDGIVLFFGVQDEKLSLFALQPKGGAIVFDQARFSTPELPFIALEY